MSYISRVGNLASAPTLRQGDNGPYLYARVLVTDRVRRDGEWVDGPVVPYEVFVKDEYAVHLSETAEACGNVRLHFSGRHWTDEYTPTGQPARVVNKVNADEVSVSLQFTAVTQTSKSAKGRTATGAPDHVRAPLSAGQRQPETPAVPVKSEYPDAGGSPWDTVSQIRQELEEG